MKTVNQNYRTEMAKLGRRISAKVDVYEIGGSSILYTFNASDALKNIKLRASTGGKIMGVAVSTQALIDIIDDGSFPNLTQNQQLVVSFIIGGYTLRYQTFYTTSISRDQSTGITRIEAWDAIAFRGDSTSLVQDVIVPDIAMNLTYQQLITVMASAQFFGVGGTNVIGAANLNDHPNTAGSWITSGTTARDVLASIAQATGTIAHVIWDELDGDVLELTNIYQSASYPLAVDREHYFNFSINDSSTITKVGYQFLANTTHYSGVVVGNTMTRNVGNGGAGYSPYMSYNCFFECDNPGMEINTVLNDICAKYVKSGTNMVIPSFTLDWRADPRIDIGDKLTVTNKDGSTSTVYYLETNIDYNGGMRENITFTLDQTNPYSRII